MAAAAVRRRLTWQQAEVVGLRRETPRAVRIVLRVPDWPGHRAGQHLDVRLTAPDGYTAQRSYSIASPPGAAQVELVVAALPDGEVSSYLTTVLRTGDLLELRGPVGGYFVWPTTTEGPVQLIGGGSGVVPLLAMWAHRRTVAARTTMPPDDDPQVYVCGPTPFVEAVARDLLGLGHPPLRVRTERFGSSGDQA